MRLIDSIRWHAAIGSFVILAAVGTAQAQCVGDCNSDGQVGFDELLVGVNRALGTAVDVACPNLGGTDGIVTVDEVVRSVHSALNECAAQCGDCTDDSPCTTDNCEGIQCTHTPVVCADDGNECTAEGCDPVTGCRSSNVENGTLCANGTGYCQGGACAAFQCTVNSHCDDRNVCTTNTCVRNSCVSTPVTCQSDGNECTAETCAASSGCGSRPVQDGVLCGSGTGTCQSGGCVSFQCVRNSDCEDSSLCTTNTCTNHSCVSAPVVCQDDGNQCTAESCEAASGCRSRAVQDGTNCMAGAGSCQGGACVAFQCVSSGDCEDGNLCTTNTCVSNSCTSTVVVCPGDGNDCTAEACEPAQGCRSNNVPNGSACNNGSGSCLGGSCNVPEEIEYQQDFEALDRNSMSALAGDKWIVFGNVFDGMNGRYKYGYGPFPAPNGGAAFSAIVVEQGGAEQGAQQLSIYNDYNNMDHSKGHRIEANVFRERKITVDDVGTTIRFSFDAKRGNINDAADPLCPCTSTALAFIKTLNPAAGFATTNFVQQVTTALPLGWQRYSLSLVVDAGLVNQLLQVGFSSNATHFQPSGVFYDNLKVSSVATIP